MRKHKKEDIILIDLNDRGNIRIIRSTRKEVTVKEMEEFENKLATRYNDYCDFTNFCINKNMEKNKQVSNQLFIDAMRSMLEQNKLLEYMISKEQEP